MGSVQQLCVCDEEWCWCTNTVTIDDEVTTYPPPEVACSKCAAGEHVMGGPADG